MNKTRVEAFTDAVLAIILTIMILEFKTPSSEQLGRILNQWPYLVSYAVGYLFIGVAWYNHHYLFEKTKLITKQIYWVNNFWLFSTSFLPVATAWTGRDLSAQGPEIFYTGVYVVWLFAYILLSYVIANTNAKLGHPEIAKDIRNMKVYQFTTKLKWVIPQIIIMILVLIYLPAIQLFLIALRMTVVSANTNSDSDRVAVNK